MLILFWAKIDYVIRSIKKAFEEFQYIVILKILLIACNCFGKL